MKSISVHGIDEELERLIQAKAHAEGSSLNKTIKRLLEEALGVKPKSKTKYEAEFRDLCGVWSSKDLEQFEAATTDLRSIDAREWQ